MQHPSPLSARRGFFGNSHFRKANEWLQQKYGLESRLDRLSPRPSANYDFGFAADAAIEWTKLEVEVQETGVVKDGEVL